MALKACWILWQRQQGWTLRNRRSQLLGALDAALRNLAGLEEALAAWAGPASAAEAALQASALMLFNLHIAILHNLLLLSALAAH